LQIGVIGGVRICKAPGPHHIASIAVQVDVNTGGILRGRSAEAIFALVREEGEHHILDRIHFWLRSCNWTAEDFTTLVTTRATTATPVEIEIAVQICTSVYARWSAVIFISVFTPFSPNFSFFSAVRVSQEHNIDLVIIQQPVHIGICVVILDEVSSEASG